jgi:hypothetical protein
MTDTAAFFDELNKIAARAGVKVIKKLISAGNVERASELAATKGVLKPTPYGHQLGILGRGSEGSAALVAHPDAGIMTRKLYDPHGVSGTEVVRRKAEIGAKVQSPQMANYYGSAQAPSGAQMHFSEYVHSGAGPSFAPGSQAEQQAVAHTKKQTERAVAGAGYGARDVRKANMVWDQGTQQYKTVDYIPTAKGEYVRGGASTPANRIYTSETSQTANPNYRTATERPITGQLERASFNPGAPPMKPRVSQQVAPKPKVNVTAPTMPRAVTSTPKITTPQLPKPSTEVSTANIRVPKIKQPAFAPTMPATVPGG